MNNKMRDFDASFMPTGSASTYPSSPKAAHSTCSRRDVAYFFLHPVCISCSLGWIFAFGGLHNKLFNLVGFTIELTIGHEKRICSWVSAWGMDP